MRKEIIFIVFLVITSLTPLRSQFYFTSDDHLINGYTVKISGTDYEYHSCIPGLRESMIMRIPSEQVQQGDSFKIKVTGSNTGTTSWYMTFKKPVNTGAEFRPFPAILKNSKSSLQLVEAGIFYFGQEGKAKIYADNKLLDTFRLKFGYNTRNLGLPPVSKPSKVKLKVEAGPPHRLSGLSTE